MLTGITALNAILAALSIASAVFQWATYYRAWGQIEQNSRHINSARARISTEDSKVREIVDARLEEKRPDPHEESSSSSSDIDMMQMLALMQNMQSQQQPQQPQQPRQPEEPEPPEKGAQMQMDIPEDDGWLTSQNSE